MLQVALIPLLLLFLQIHEKLSSIVIGEGGHVCLPGYSGGGNVCCCCKKFSF